MIIWEYIYCVYTKESLLYTQEISCACTTLLCILWARDPRGPNKGAVQGLGPAQRLFWVPGPWGPWPRACTRVLCMHKRSLVYTQEILLCIHNKCINVTSVAMLRSYAKLCETMRNHAKLYETMRNYAKLCEIMRNYAKLYGNIRNYAKLCQTMRNYVESMRLYARLIFVNVI